MHVYHVNNCETFLQNNGKNISWKHLMKLYTTAQDPSKHASGLSILPKLKYEHVYLTSFSKMHVDPAAQVSTIK